MVWLTKHQFAAKFVMVMINQTVLTIGKDEVSLIFQNNFAGLRVNFIFMNEVEGSELIPNFPCVDVHIYTIVVIQPQVFIDH